MIASLIPSPASVFIGLGIGIIGLATRPRYIFVDYDFRTYTQCSILSSYTNIKAYDGTNKIRDNLISTDARGSWGWQGDPNFYGYPAACRSLVSSYKYPSGRF